MVRKPSKHQLQVNGVYDFRTVDGKLKLVPYPLPGLPASRPTKKPAADKGDLFCTIPVKLLVDDKEPTVQRLWEKRYRARLAEASAIIDAHCRVRFEVVGVGTWTSDPNAREMQQLINEFERAVDPSPARLAIRFHGPVQNAAKGQSHGRNLRAVSLASLDPRVGQTNGRAGTAGNPRP